MKKKNHKNNYAIIKTIKKQNNFSIITIHHLDYKCKSRDK